MELAIGHLVRVDKLVMHGAKLQPSHEIGTLVKRAYRSIERSANFGRRVIRLVPYRADQIVNALLRRPLSEMKVHGEHYACRPMHSPEKCTHTLLGSLIIGTLNNGLVLLGVSSPMQLIIKGAIIVAAVAFTKR